MTRVDAVRTEIQRLMKAVPFRPFVLSFENGDRVVIEHPENIAFDPGKNGQAASEDFYVLSSKLRLFSTFSSVTSVALVDRGD